MEKTLQEKAEEAMQNKYHFSLKAYGLKANSMSDFKDGYSLHAQESKAMEDKYKKVVRALATLIELWKDNDESTSINMDESTSINMDNAFEQAESTLKDLTQDKL